MMSSLLSVVLTAAPAGFAIIVGNNASPSLHLPELRYADDDAARMTETFGVLGRVEVALLTTFDADTARLHPHLSARAAPPTKANVEAAFGRLSAWAETERAAGRRTRGYFVFSGHGDMERGEGFLELADARLGATDFERLLKSAKVDELHVVLDSCNSWFVISPRRAGGQFFPTPAEATRALVERLPHVGVLVSTSAESEVYEWSELQSGVFSYALRSGLVGGADANHDGDLTYAELAAFVDTATRAIKNPSYRPRVFARGPGGGTGQGFASLDSAAATVLVTTLNEPVRLRVRDGDGIRLFDLNVTKGPERRLFLPKGLVVPGLVVERATAEGWLEFKLPTGQAVVRLSELEVAEVQAAARGLSTALTELFEESFGEADVDSWTAREVAEQGSRALGVSRAAVDRVSFFLDMAAEREARERKQVLVSGGLVAGVGAVVLAGSLISNAQQPPTGASLVPDFTRGLLPAVGVLCLVEGAFLLGFSLIQTTPWTVQRTAFIGKRDRGETNAAMVGLDTFVRERLRTQETLKTTSIFLGVGALALGAGAGVAAAVLRNERALFVPVLTNAAVLGFLGVMLIASAGFQRLPEADLLDVLQYERRQGAPVQVGFSPIPGGGALSLSGSF
jgi:hypothetical protein